MAHASGDEDVEAGFLESSNEDPLRPVMSDCLLLPVELKLHHPLKYSESGDSFELVARGSSFGAASMDAFLFLSRGLTLSLRGGMGLGSDRGAT